MIAEENNVLAAVEAERPPEERDERALEQIAQLKATLQRLELQAAVTAETATRNRGDITEILRHADMLTADEDPLQGVTDDLVGKAILDIKGHNGIDVRQDGDAVSITPSALDWYVAETCGGNYRRITPGEEIAVRHNKEVVWDGECFLNYYHEFVYKDRCVYKMNLNCNEIIVCTQDCTELVDPLCGY